MIHLEQVFFRPLSMAYFTPDFIQFYQELEINNNRDWFNDNRKRYESNVRDPFKAFINELIIELNKRGADFDIAPKDCIFRINRDVRFSKDKTPYKPHSSAALAKGGKKDRETPGMYIAFSGSYAQMGGGLYGIEKENLYFLREYIFNHQDEFLKIINDEKFKATFGEVRGERNKIIPKEFKSALEKVPEIANKHFFYMQEHQPPVVLQADLMDQVLHHWEVAGELRSFLSKGISST